MKPSIQLRLAQHLALTPQLQQSIRLLQLSTLELNQELEQALMDNPLLERDDDPLAGHARLAGDGAILDDGRGVEAPGPADGGAEAEHAPAGFQVLADQHRYSFAVVFYIRDRKGDVVDIGADGRQPPDL